MGAKFPHMTGMLRTSGMAGLLFAKIGCVLLLLWSHSKSMWCHPAAATIAADSLPCWKFKLSTTILHGNFDTVFKPDVAPNVCFCLVTVHWWLWECLRWNIWMTNLSKRIKLHETNKTNYTMKQIRKTATNSMAWVIDTNILRKDDLCVLFISYWSTNTCVKRI